ncbi:MAG TPA: hypothetical protein VHW24_10725, partial [Bryobacteraceae bacterium]|nr:hypothetical protein [Bryobacteraceae bacterium]
MISQIAAVFRLEWRKTFLSRRAWWIYILAAAPVAVTVIHWLMSAHSMDRVRQGLSRGHSLGDDSNIYAAIFQFFYLRGAIFFGCVGIFTNLFRAEMLEKTLHYYYLTPVRR